MSSVPIRWKHFLIKEDFFQNFMAALDNVHLRNTISTAQLLAREKSSSVRVITLLLLFSSTSQYLFPSIETIIVIPSE